MALYSKLEEAFCEFTGYDYAVAVNSGTAGLHLAVEALGAKRVAIPNFTMAACAFACSYAGAEVVTVDCGEDLNMRPELVPDDVDAVMPVHIYGRKAFTDYDLPTIVDMSEAHGIECTGDIAVYSLYQNKIVHAEEGGIVVTNNKDYADDMRDLKNMAFGDKHNYYHERVGYNYRMPESQAEMALKSLEKVQENLEKRWQVNEWYNEILDHHSVHDVDWVHDFYVQDNSIVDDIPEARYFFKPISSLPMYDGTGGLAREKSEKGMYLPIYPHYSKTDVERICNPLLNRL